MIIAMVLRVSRLTKRPDFLGCIWFSFARWMIRRADCTAVRRRIRYKPDILPFYAHSVTIQ